MKAKILLNGAGLSNPLASDKDKASLPATLALTAFIAYWIQFFILAMGGAKLGGIVMFIWFTLLYYMILRSGKPAKYRRIFFVSIALLFFPSFIANLIEARGSMAINAQQVVANEIPYCHIVTPMMILPWALTQTIVFPASLSGGYTSMYSMLVIWVVATLAIGRGWCSWVCFYGGWDDLFSRAREKPAISIAGKEEGIRRFSYAMLAFVVLASLASLSAVYCVWLCPFKLITEYVAIADLSSYLATILFILTFFGLVVVMPLLTRKRFQCAAFCPFGAMQSIIDRVSPFRVRIDTSKCISCGACVRACSICAIDDALIAAKAQRPHRNCVKCGECVTVCPQGAIRLAFSFEKKAHEAKPDKPRLDKLGPVSAARRLLSILAELLQPRILFTSTAFIFGMVISSKFSVQTVNMAIQALTGLFTGGR